MPNRWLAMIEAHVEKGILVLSVGFMGWMLWSFIINSPNKVQYGGKEYGPRDLLEAVKRDADTLETAIRNAKPEDVDESQFAFSERLRQEHDAGIYAKVEEEDVPPPPELPKELVRATPLGEKIVVPGLEESQTPAGSITLVTPLKPSRPVVRTGRSLAMREGLEVDLLGEVTVPEAGPEGEKPREVGWVTVGAYFDKKAQYNECIKAGYAPYRSKAYIAGLEVQRQEVLSNGQYSDWEGVKVSKSMPKVECPEPAFDDATGELLNKDEIRQAFGTIKAAQSLIMQSPFYVVDDGDLWEPPALAGLEEDEDAEEEEEPEFAAAGGSRRPTPQVLGGGSRLAPSGPRGGGRTIGAGRSPGGGRALGGGTMLGGGRTGGRGMPSGGGAQSEADKKREGRKEIRDNLKEARKLIGQKQYSEALALANSVLGSEYATKGSKRSAKQLISVAERKIEKASGRELSRLDQEVEELVQHPETKTPAVWFHDDTVQPGKTYRYRMRVELWNRYVGQTRPMKNPADARESMLAGEWSLPSDPITVTPNTNFFFTGGRPPATANVEVWKWYQGRWISERFDVSEGDVIGGSKTVELAEYDEDGNEVRKELDFSTDAIVLDLRFDDSVAERSDKKDAAFDYRTRTSPVMVYLDPADGQVKERVLNDDRRNPLREEYEEQSL